MTKLVREAIAFPFIAAGYLLAETSEPLVRIGAWIMGAEYEEWEDE